MSFSPLTGGIYPGGYSPYGLTGAGSATAYHAPSATNNTGAEGETSQKKTGFRGFLTGLKNGLVNTAKGLFTTQGLVTMLGTMALVAVTGGAAILPLVALGVGLGGYQIVKGAMTGDTEKMGEGVFTVGASVLGAKLAPNEVGGRTLSNPSIWGKLKAPFSGKGVFKDVPNTFWDAFHHTTRSAIGRIGGGAKGRVAGEPTVFDHISKFSTTWMSTVFGGYNVKPKPQETAKAVSNNRPTYY